MSPSSVPKQGFGFFVEQMDDECVLYRLGAQKAIHLNESAALIWRLCDGSRTLQEITDLLKAEYPTSEPEVAADVGDTIDLLHREGALLEVSNSNAAAAP